MQLVLTDRSDLSAGRVRRHVAIDLPAGGPVRQARLPARRPGLGSMPLHIVRRDIDEGRLAMLSIEDISAAGLSLTMSVIYKRFDPPGPAVRWTIKRLKRCFSPEMADESNR